MKTPSKITLSAIAFLILSAFIGLIQIWLELFSTETFTKITFTIWIVGVVIFVGGLLYHEYLDNRNNKDKNLLG